MVRERLREKELNTVLVSSQEDIRKRTNKLESENLDYRRQIQRLNVGHLDLDAFPPNWIM